MGVPAFYRWLAGGTAIVVEAAEDRSRASGDQSTVAVTERQRIRLPLPRHERHHYPCVHPEGRPARTVEEMYSLIFAYIDRLFAVVRPRKLLMAIDGPAPRAKMNQQRSRRFKAAKERAEKAAADKALRAEMRAAGHEPPPKAHGSFDSNVITPGTSSWATWRSG